MKIRLGNEEFSLWVSHRRVTICELRNKAGQLLADDIAICAPGDVFDPKEGERIVVNRVARQLADVFYPWVLESVIQAALAKRRADALKKTKKDLQAAKNRGDAVFRPFLVTKTQVPAPPIQTTRFPQAQTPRSRSQSPQPELDLQEFLRQILGIPPSPPIRET